MALPKAAQKQASEAEELHRKLYPVESDSTDAETTAEPAAATPPQEEPAADTPPQEEQPAAEKPASDEGDTWEQRYKVLQGKYNAEVPRLQRQLNAANAAQDDLRGQVEELQKALLKPEKSEEQPKSSSLLKQEEIDDYGEDMIDVVKRAAREEFQPYIEQLEQRNAQLESLLGGMQQQTVANVRQQMLSDLDSDPEVRNWREINSDPQFLAWLENVDPYVGQPRMDLLRRAFEENRTAQVKAFFKGFLDENAALTPGREQASAATPQVNLETLVAPGTATGGDTARAQQEDGAKPTYTEQDIQKFYRDVQKGVYRDDPKTRERIERDIFAAQRENRIR